MQCDYPFLSILFVWNVLVFYCNINNTNHFHLTSSIKKSWLLINMYQVKSLLLPHVYKSQSNSSVVHQFRVHHPFITKPVLNVLLSACFFSASKCMQKRPSPSTQTNEPPHLILDIQTNTDVYNILILFLFTLLCRKWSYPSFWWRLWDTGTADKLTAWTRQGILARH